MVQAQSLKKKRTLFFFLIFLWEFHTWELNLHHFYPSPSLHQLLLWPLLHLTFVSSSFIIVLHNTQIQPADPVQCCSYAYVFRSDHKKLDNLTGGPSMEKPFFLSQRPFVDYSSSSRGGTFWESPYPCWECQLVLLLCWSCLGNNTVEISWVQLHCHM